MLHSIGKHSGLTVTRMEKMTGIDANILVNGILGNKNGSLTLQEKKIVDDLYKIVESVYGELKDAKLVLKHLTAKN